MASRHRLTLLSHFVFAFGLTGCAAVMPGGAPISSFNLDNDIAALEVAFAPAANILKVNAADATVVTRNAFIDGRLALYNIRYIEFVQKLGTGKQSLDAGTEILLLGTSTAGVLTGGATAKANLAAAATVIAGAKSSIDKNFYFEKTLPALVAEFFKLVVA